MVVTKAPSLQTSSFTKATQLPSGEANFPIVSREHPAMPLPGTFPAMVRPAVNISAAPNQQAARTQLRPFNRNMLFLDVLLDAGTSVFLLLLLVFLSGPKNQATPNGVAGARSGQRRIQGNPGNHSGSSPRLFSSLFLSVGSSWSNLTTTSTPR